MKHIYSNLLEVLDVVCNLEQKELYETLNSSELSRFYVQDKYTILLTIEDEIAKCLSSTRFPDVYYRGQNEYFPKCIPSLYRINGEEKLLLARLQVAEFIELVLSHQIVPFFEKPFPVQIGDKEYMKHLNVDAYSLAQHYGLPTNMLDITLDKYVAAFFATNKWVSNFQYEPIGDGVGAFYLYKKASSSQIIDIGLQPFLRPGEQKAFGLLMEEGEDFNEMDGVKVFLFKQDKEISQFYSDLMYGGKKLSEFDVLSEKIERIKSLKVFSRKSEQQVRTQFYVSLSDEEWLNLCNKYKIAFQDGLSVNFTEEEMYFYTKLWKDKYGHKYEELISANVLQM